VIHEIFSVVLRDYYGDGNGVEGFFDATLHVFPTTLSKVDDELPPN
jgi:hypothetical protein